MLYFGNMRHNLVALDVFAKVVKLTNHTRLWDTDVAWYSPNATCWICFMAWINHIIEIHSLKPTWFCLIISVLTDQVKFLLSSGYCTVINCTLIFRKTNIFVCFGSVMAESKLVKHNLMYWLFKFHNEWSNVLHVSAPSTAILLITV